MVRMKMAYFLKTILVLVFLLHISNIIFVKAEDSSDDGSASPYLCLNCPHCTKPCEPFPPPPPYPFYGAPPPPSPLGQGSGAPPSPVQCPPTPVQCCQNPPPQGSGSGSGSGSTNQPYYNYSVSPPSPTFHRIFSAFFSILLFFYFAL